MSDLLTTEPAEALVELANDDARRLTVRLYAFGEVARTPQGPEAIAPGAIEGTDPADVVLEAQDHGGQIAGRAERLYEREDAAYADFRVSDTNAGRDLVTLVRDGVLRRASISYLPRRSHPSPEGHSIRDRIDLRRVAVLPQGAFRSAEVVAMRSEMTDERVTTPQEAQEGPQSPGTQEVDLGPVSARIDALEASTAELHQRAAYDGPSARSHRLEEYRSYGEAWLAATTDPELRETLDRVLADQITSDNPGLIEPKNDIPRIVLPYAMPRRAVQAFGGPIAAPPSGLTATWPMFDTTSTFAVGPQPTGEKNEVVTGTVKHAQGSAALVTYAGAVDVSLQLLQRSDPSYRELLLREMARQYAIATDDAFCTVLEASTTTAGVVWAGTDDAADMANLVDALIAQSLAIETASGVAAGFALAATDVWQSIAQNSELYPAQYGTANVRGTSAANPLSVSVAGIPIIHNPNLTATKMILSEPQAAGWIEDGPFNIDALQVSRLGHDHAIYGYGAGALLREAAVVVITFSAV